MIEYMKHKLSGVYGIWFVTLMLLNISQISAYYHTSINQFILSFSVMGFMYCLRTGVFKKENRITCAVVSIVSALVGVYWINTNVFNVYFYYNYTLAIALIIFANLYAVLIKGYCKERRFPSVSKYQILILLLFVTVLISVSGIKFEVFRILFLILPIFLIKHTKEEKIQAVKGMIDGTIIGFLVGQAYAFGFQHYTYVRYHGYCMNTTYGGLMYMYTYNAFLAKYVIAKLEQKPTWKTAIYWWMSAFVLALLYLTGGRSPVMGIIAITATFFLALQWLCKRRVHIMKWLLQCAAIGGVSLLLFPVAYGSVRYLPTIIDRPDYIDSLGNTFYSPMVSMGQTYCYDNLFIVGPDGLVVEPTYVPFEASLYECIGRIVPGGTTVIEKIYDALGITYVEELEARLEAEKENTRKRLEQEKQQEQTTTIPEVKLPQQDVLLVSASDNIRVTTEPLVQEATTEVKLKGSSADEPWFTLDDELTSFGIRYSIHRYAISKLNLRGHESSGLNFYMLEGQGPQPHAHNIFLIYGYNYGIPAMICLFAVIVGLICKYMRCLIKEREIHALFGLGIALTTFIFGMFEFSFAVTMYITYIIYLLPFLAPSEQQ